MSLFKRIWIEQDPAYAEARRTIAGNPAEIIPKYPHGAPLRRRNRLADRPHWDPLWPGLLHQAVDALSLDSIMVNSRIMFRNKVDRDAAVIRAEAAWEAEIKRRYPYAR